MGSISRVSPVKLWKMNFYFPRRKRDIPHFLLSWVYFQIHRQKGGTPPESKICKVHSLIRKNFFNFPSMNKFSNFSLNLFLLLCGFFWGNLFGAIEENIPKLGFAFSEKLNPTQVGNELEMQNFKGDSPWEQNSQLEALPLFSGEFLRFFPGPGILGLIVLFLAELCNWATSRQGALKKRNSLKKFKSFQGVSLNPLNLQLGLDQNFLGNNLENNRSWGKSQLQKSFVPYLNSFKIGFLLGIFVDAFKVGS